MDNAHPIEISVGTSTTLLYFARVMVPGVMNKECDVLDPVLMAV